MSTGETQSINEPSGGSQIEANSRDGVNQPVGDQKSNFMVKVERPNEGSDLSLRDSHSQQQQQQPPQQSQQPQQPQQKQQQHPETDSATVSAGGGNVLNQARSVANRRTQRPFGPCYAKMLVTNVVAGSIIGQRGSVITQLEADSGCAIRLSQAESYFPGTTDRVLVIGGPSAGIEKVIDFVLTRCKDAASGEPPQDVERRVGKLVVPNSSVSPLIGIQGTQIKQLQDETGARIQISSREKVLLERIVSISGSLEAVYKAACKIVTALQADPNLKDHTNVAYPTANPAIERQRDIASVPASMPRPDVFLTYPANVPSYGALPINTFGPPVAASLSYPLALSQVDFPANAEIFAELPDETINYIGSFFGDIALQTGTRIRVLPKTPGSGHVRRVSFEGLPKAIYAAHYSVLLKLAEKDSRTMRLSGGRQFDVPYFPQLTYVPTVSELDRVPNTAPVGMYMPQAPRLTAVRTLTAPGVPVETLGEFG